MFGWLGKLVARWRADRILNRYYKARAAAGIPLERSTHPDWQPSADKVAQTKLRLELVLKAWKDANG